MIYILNLFTSCFEMRVLNFHGFRRQAPLALQANPNTAGFDQTTRKYKHAPNFGQIQEVTRKTSSNGSPGTSSNLVAMASNILQPSSDILQPNSDGLQPNSDILQPSSDGL